MTHSDREPVEFIPGDFVYLSKLLRCYACETDDQWVDALPMAEFCFNNVVNESLRLSPFEANYGFKPLTPFILHVNLSAKVLP